MFGLGLAFVLLGETVTVVQGLGSAAMLAGAWLAVTEPGTKPTPDSGLQLLRSV